MIRYAVLPVLALAGVVDQCAPPPPPVAPAECVPESEQYTTTLPPLESEQYTTTLPPLESEQYDAPTSESEQHRP